MCFSIFRWGEGVVWLVLDTGLYGTTVAGLFHDCSPGGLINMILSSQHDVTLFGSF